MKINRYFGHAASLLLIILGIGVLYSCNEPTEQNRDKNKKEAKKSLMKVNKNLVKTEDQKIEDFIARYKWNMEVSGTGLRYWIYEQGAGKKAEKGKVAVISFTVSLLNGEECYSSRGEEPKSFKIGKGGVESGIEEGILLLKEGDRAKFIIPSHLAFGLLGDMNKIPSKAALVYDIELLEIK